MEATDDGIVWGLWGGVGESGSVTFKTPSYDTKTGSYACLDLSLDAIADILFLAENTEISFFSVYTAVDTKVNAIAGYHTGGEAALKKELPTCVIPVAGPISLTIKPYLVMNASGEFSVEATAEITNHLSFYFATYEGDDSLEKKNDTNVDLDFKAEAEGKLEVGPEMEVNVTLCGTQFFDGLELITADAFMGFGVHGATSVEQGLDISASDIDYHGHQTTPDEDGNLHICYLCIQGEAYMVDRLSMGLSDALNEQLKKYFDTEVTFTMPDMMFKLFDWHYSAGPTYGPEFELCACPHIAYPVEVQVIEKNSGEGISGVTVYFTGQDMLTTNQEGRTSLWLEDGTYEYAVYKENYEPEPLTGSITMNNEKQTLQLVLEEISKDLPVVQSSNMMEYDGIMYTCQRNVPGIAELPFEAAAYDYICGFAFYRKRVYYSCKDAGTSDYRSSIYSCNLDGSDLQLLLDCPNPLYNCTFFFIADGILYTAQDYNSNSVRSINLETGEVTVTALSTIPEIAEYYNYRNPHRIYFENAYYCSDGTGTGMAPNCIWKVENGKTEVFNVLTSVDSMIHLEAVTADYLYFSYYSNEMDYLARYNRVTGVSETLDSHQSAGSGGYFNW